MKMKKLASLLLCGALLMAAVPAIGGQAAAAAPAMAHQYPVYTMSTIPDGTVLPDNYGNGSSLSTAFGANERSAGDIVTSVVYRGTGMALKWTTLKGSSNYNGGLVYLEPAADNSATTDWSGASDLLVYVDASELTTGVPTVDFRLNTDDNTNVWGLKVGGTVYTKADGASTWSEQSVAGNNTHRIIRLTAGFTGWVRLPLAADSWTAAWGGAATGNFTVEGKTISRIWVGFGGESNSEAFVNKSIYFSNFSLGAASAKTAAAPVFSQAGTLSTTSYKNGATDILDLTATQADGREVRYELTTAPTHGRVTLDTVTGYAVYVPAQNYTGSDTFTVRAYNYGWYSGEATKTVNVTVDSQTNPDGSSSVNNTAPYFPASSDWWGVTPRLTLRENTSASITYAAKDADRNTLAYLLSAKPQHGTAVLDKDTGRVTYTPEDNYVGADRYTVMASDGNGGIASVTVNVTVVDEDKVLVACVGDSITFGLCASDRATTSYPAQLQKLLGDNYYVENYGISGIQLLINPEKDFSFGTSPFMDQSLAFDPDIVVIMLGTNDAHLMGSQADQFQPVLEDLIETYQNLPSAPQVFVNTAPYWASSTSLNATLENIIIPKQLAAAEATGCPVIDIHPLYQLRPNLLDDGLHPNDAGYVLLAQTVAPYINYVYNTCEDMPGDINYDGKVTVSDVRIALRAAIGKTTLDSMQEVVTDVNYDGKISVSDVRAILRRAVGKIDSLYSPINSDSVFSLCGAAENTLAFCLHQVPGATTHIQSAEPVAAYVDGEETTFSWILEDELPGIDTDICQGHDGHADDLVAAAFIDGDFEVNTAYTVKVVFRVTGADGKTDNVVLRAHLYIPAYGGVVPAA